MNPTVATLVYAAGIVALFVFGRDRGAKSSAALWIPVAWLWIVGSRDVSHWLAIAGIGTYTASDPDLEGNAVDRIVFGALILLGIIALAGRGPEVRRLLSTNVPIILFFLYCLMSTLWSDYPTVALKRWIKAVGDLVMVLIVLTERDWIAALRRILTRVGFVLIPLSVLFIKYYPALAVDYKQWSGKAMYSGITTTKNLLGMVCLVFGIASLWRLFTAFRERHTRLRIPHLVAHTAILVMAAWLLRMCNSMTSIACLLLAGILLGLMNIPFLARKRSVLHFLVAAAVMVSASTLFLGTGAGALESMGRDPTLTGRTEIWKLVLTLAGNPFVGTGFESFWTGTRLRQVWSVMFGIQEAHNGYLELYLNLGWVGVTLFASVVLYGYRSVTAAMREDFSSGSIRVAYFVIAVIYNFTEAGFRMCFMAWIFFLLAIMPSPAKRRVGGHSGMLPQRKTGQIEGLVAVGRSEEHPVFERV